MAESPAAAPLPDVAHFRAHGCAGIRVFCVACGRMTAPSFEALAARDDETIADLARRPFRCRACGGRKVSLMPDWPAVNAGGLPATPPAG